MLASSVASVLAPSLPALVAARAACGVGAALLLATGPALLAAAFPAPGPGRARAFAAFGIAAGGGIVLGPLLGGLLVAAGDWRAGFALYLPLAAGGLPASAAMPESRDPQAQQVDYPSAVGFTVAIAAAVFALVHGSEAGWTLVTLLAVLLAVGGFAAFVVASRRRARPMVDLSVLSNPVLAGMSLIMLAWQIGFATLMVYGPSLPSAPSGSPLWPRGW